MRHALLTLFALALMATLIIDIAPAQAQEPAPAAPVATSAPATPEGQPAAPDRVSPVVPEPSGVALPAALPVEVLPPEPGLLAQLGQGVLPYLIQGAGLVLMALFGWLLVWIQRKTKVDLGAAKDSMIREAARKAIGGAEEWLANLLKIGLKPDHTKLQWATGALLRQFPDVLPADLQRVITEELGAMAGVGATGDKAIGAGISAMSSLPLLPGLATTGWVASIEK